THREPTTLPLHDALPICDGDHRVSDDRPPVARRLSARQERLGHAGTLVDRDDVVRSDVYIDNMVLCGKCGAWKPLDQFHQSSKRSEEHTSELQSLAYLVC